MVLPAGTTAARFTLPAEGNGADELSLSQLTAEGPALLVFLKTSCPVCRISFPVWAELVRRYGDAVATVAVSQDPPGKTRPWLDELGFDAPVLDDSDGYEVSDAYRLETVPSLVLVGHDGRVLASSQGWDRERANAWDAELAELSGRPSPGPVSTPDDGLPPFRPG